jgi:hypothetical protein
MADALDRPESAPATLSDHISDNVEGVVALQRREADALSPAQRRLERIGRFVGRPTYLVGVLLTATLWVVFNVTAPYIGFRSFRTAARAPGSTGQSADRAESQQADPPAGGIETRLAHGQRPSRCPGPRSARTCRYRESSVSYRQGGPHARERRREIGQVRPCARLGRSPEMLRGVGTPGPPLLGALQELRSGGAPTIIVGQCASQPDIRGGKGIRLPQLS